MIIYNVTINVDDSINEEWLRWMKETHIPAVMHTGLFQSHKIFRLLSRQAEEEGVTYAIQYACEDIELYEKYQAEFAGALQAETEKRYAGHYVAFRTLLEEL